MTTAEIETGFKEIKELFRETDKKFQETERELSIRFKETDKRIKELANLFTGHWGKLIEALAESGIVELMQKRGINVTESATRVIKRKNGREMELDFLLTNDTDLVVGEVKTTLKVEDVRLFMEELARFLHFFPKYQGYKIYGAIIGIKIEENADKFAYRNGLFVLKVGGEGTLRMLNDEAFQPVDFGRVKPDPVSPEK
jgi:hypothetical protein